MENTTPPNINQSNTSVVGEPQAPSHKSFSPKYLVIALVILIVLVASYFALMGIKSTGTNPSSSNPQPTATSQKTLPKHNLLVFTRCIGGERQPNSCRLYVSGLKEPQEQIVYAFDFPKIQQTDYEGGFLVSLHGVINKNAVYTKLYWEKENNEQRDINILGTINLDTGEDNIIYKQIHYQPKNGARDERDNGYYSGVYLDRQNNRVYYSTEIGPGTGGKIYQYNLNTKQNTTIADNKKLDNTYKVEYASKDKLYLSYSNDYITGNYSISKIFDLITSTLTNTSKSWYNAVINKQGTKVAYIEEQPLTSDKTYTTNYNISLKVSDLEGKDVKEIYAIPNTRLPADGYNGTYSYAFVSNYFFNEYGDRLSFSVRKSKWDGTRYSGEDVNSYISFLEVRNKPDPEFSTKGGIILVPPDNQNLYKTLVKVKPSEQKYSWVKFLTYEGPIQGTPEDAILYGADGGWYLKENIAYAVEEKEIDLSKDRKVILTNAKNVFLAP